MTTRKEVSVIQNLWNDAQRVDQGDLETEQNHNNEIDAAIVQNHFGSGVLIATPEQVVLFDSDELTADQSSLLAAGDFDGTGLDAHRQPSDPNLGNQIEVTLTDSSVFGRRSVKVAVIGLAFDDTVQMERFYFRRNGKQVSSKHYKRILTIFTNDFKGNNNCSRNHGGHLVIRETASFQISSDPIMVAQDVEPDLFWRDFKIADPFSTLSQTLQAGMGSEYSFDALNINTYGKFNREILAGDTNTRLGQKFLATTNNIQKITLLMGIKSNDLATEEDKFDWSGNIIVGIYALQTTTSSPSDIIPALALDFDPSPNAIAEISYTQDELRNYGYILTNVLQPIDFVFNSTSAGSVSSPVIEPGKYYAVTVRRAGAVSTGDVLLGQGNNRTDDSHLTVFNGIWVDVPDEDLWFQVWTDAAKIADGQGYDGGKGILYPKTAQDTATGTVIDYQARHFPFANTGENVANIAVLQATVLPSVQVQDERTGNPVNSRKTFAPAVNFVTESELSDLKETSEPLVIGCILDRNAKTNPLLDKTQQYPGLAKNNEFVIVNPDPDLLSLSLIGSNLVPDSTCCADSYKIFKVTVCTDGYGDVNGDGNIDADDVILAASLIGESVYFPSTQQKIADGYFDTLQLLRADVDGDGYVTSDDLDLITSYVNRTINSFPAGSYFTHMTLKVEQSVGRWDGYFDCDGYVRLDGYIGQNLISPEDLSPSEQLYDGYIIEPQLQLHAGYMAIPFVPLPYQIIHYPFWQPYLVIESSEARKVTAAFTFDEKVPDRNCSTATTFACSEPSTTLPTVDPGRNDFFAPDNLIIGRGEILRPDGSHYPVDFEIGTVILQLPAIPLAESALNIFDKFVADRGDGFTRAGYPAMRYADCSTVQTVDLALGKLRFNVSLQSFSPNLDGYSPEDGYGVIVDDIIGVYMDAATGILKLTMKDLAVSDIYQTLVSKIQILVYLKKAGWNNQPLVVNPSEVVGLISS